jgi:hypothetical protein
MFALFDVSMRMDRVHLWRGNRIASREPQGNELPYKLMKHKTYILNSRLPAEKAIARVGDLLTKEGVQYRTEGLSIFSISMPIALLSLQRTLYSDRNWVGVNPFTFISGIDARCQLDTSGLTKIIVQVNKFRTFLWVAFWVCNSALAASAMPKPDGALLFIAVSLAAWFGFVSFLGGYLIKKEITDCLNA